MRLQRKAVQLESNCKGLLCKYDFKKYVTLYISINHLFPYTLIPRMTSWLIFSFSFLLYCKIGIESHGFSKQFSSTLEKKCHPL